MEQYQEILENWIHGNKSDVFEAYENMNDYEKEQFINTLKAYEGDFVDILAYLLYKLI